MKTSSIGVAAVDGAWKEIEKNAYCKYLQSYEFGRLDDEN